MAIVLSQSFGSARPRRANILAGGGLGAEIRDLRTDIEKAFLHCEGLIGLGTARPLDYLDFIDQVATPTYNPGRMFYANNIANLMTDFPDVIIQIGEETQAAIVNKSGMDLTNGTPVAILGAQGQRLAVTAANSEDDSTLSVIGLLTHDVANNQNGRATVFGKVRDLVLPTTSWTVGDKVFVNGGGFTKTPPLDAGHYLAFIGWVTQAHPVNGIIDVNPHVEPRVAGTTAQRPILYRVGSTWFDTTLGKPIWRAPGGTWVDSDGLAA